MLGRRAGWARGYAGAMVLRVAVTGATGRMGRLVQGLVEREPDLGVAALLDSSSGMELLDGADAVVDVSVPAASPGIVAAALDRGIPVLVGTSGWTAERLAPLRTRLAGLPDLGVVVVPNFSVGSVLATRFAAVAARYFDSAEIIETHHPGKIDSPSGTATRTAERMAESRAELGPMSAPHYDQRARGQTVASIPVHSLRLPGVEARQDVVFGGTGETLTIAHETTSPRSYEAGILLALRALPSARGLTVGLDSLLGL